MPFTASATTETPCACCSSLPTECRHSGGVLTLTTTPLCSTREGEAELCGFSEYTTPSTPPKKYRDKEIQEDIRYCELPEATGSCEGTATANRLVISGHNTYDADTCALTEGAEKTHYQDAGVDTRATRLEVEYTATASTRSGSVTASNNRMTRPSSSAVGMVIVFLTVPVGSSLTVGASYYIKVVNTVDAGYITLAESPGGAEVDITADGAVTFRYSNIKLRAYGNVTFSGGAGYTFDGCRITEDVDDTVGGGTHNPEFDSHLIQMGNDDNAGGTSISWRTVGSSFSHNFTVATTERCVDLTYSTTEDYVWVRITNSTSSVEYARAGPVQDGAAPECPVATTVLSTTTVSSMDTGLSFVSLTTARTTRTLTANVSCAIYDMSGTNKYITSSGTASESLTVEDTEAAAVSRSTPSDWSTFGGCAEGLPCCEASRTARGAGVFTFDYTDAKLKVIGGGLLAGAEFTLYLSIDYRDLVTLATGAHSVLEQALVADGSGAVEHTFDIPTPASGYAIYASSLRYELTDITIAIDPETWTVCDDPGENWAGQLYTEDPEGMIYNFVQHRATWPGAALGVTRTVRFEWERTIWGADSWADDGYTETTVLGVALPTPSQTDWIDVPNETGFQSRLKRARLMPA